MSQPNWHVTAPRKPVSSPFVSPPAHILLPPRCRLECRTRDKSLVHPCYLTLSTPTSTSAKRSNSECAVSPGRHSRSMEDLQQRPHESAQRHTSHDPSELAFPQVPRHELNGHKHAGDITLPDLRTVLSPQFEASAQASAEAAFASRCSPMSARSLPPIDIGNNGHMNGTRRSMDMAMASPSEAGSLHGEEDRGRRAKSIVSMEDPDVRLAAEALSGLGNPGKK